MIRWFENLRCRQGDSPNRRENSAAYLVGFGFFFLICYLFLQVAEDGIHGVLFKFPDKLFLIIGLLFLIAAPKVNRERGLVLALIFSFYMAATTFVNYFQMEDAEYSYLDEKYNPLYYMGYHTLAIVGLILLSLSKYSVNIPRLTAQINMTVFFCASLSASFLLAFLINLLGLDLRWGLDLSYGFPRLQGFMIEPSYAGYVFFILFVVSQSFYPKLVFGLCTLLTLSLSVYAGVFVYFAVKNPKYALVFLGVLFISFFVTQPQFFVDRFNEISDFIEYGSLNGISLIRVFNVIESLSYDYNFFGKGIGSTLYLVGPDSTIIPWFLLILYEIGYLGFFILSIFFLYHIVKVSKPELAMLLFALTYNMINSGNIHIFWAVLAILPILRAISSRDVKSDFIF